MISGLQAVNGAAGNLSGTSGLSAPWLKGSAESRKPADSPFGDLLKDAVGKVNQLETEARTAVDGLMTGTGVDVHQAMIASEKASMAFELALAVRNKAIQSYQSVMSMQF